MDNRVDTPTLTTRLVNGINDQLQRGSPVSLDAIPGVLDALKNAHSDGLNDRLFLLEDVLGLLSRLPPGRLQQDIQDATIGLLYHDLPHPPINFLPASIPLADYKAAQDPEAARRIKTGLGTVDVDESNTGAGAGASAGGASAGAGAGAEPTKKPNGICASSPPDLSCPPPTTMPMPMPMPTTATMATTVDKKKYSTQFRTPTGADNNPHMPLLGASNTPYARSVSGLRPIPPSALPDPGVVFDALLRRPAHAPPRDPTIKGQGHGQEHPSGVSTLMFAFGTLLIHTLFRTSPGPDKNLNLTSSYLDLSVLYGSNEPEMDSVRRKDGTGRLWEDTWADSRLIAMVPAVGALMVVFSRNHNVRTFFYCSIGSITVMPVARRHQAP